MFGVLFAFLLLGLLVAVIARFAVEGRDRMLRLLVLGYVARLGIHLFSRDLELFSHGGGGDWVAYEALALEISRIWQFSGVEYMTNDQMPILGPTTLPHNLFALIMTLNGGEPTSFACTSLIAFMACMTCFNLYALALQFGAAPRPAFGVTAAILFSPAYLLYTSDMYKDGLVIFFVTAALGSSIRLARRFSVLHLVIGLVSLWALLYVRHYLVFVVSAPLIVGVAGLRATSSARPVITSLVLLAVFFAVAASTDVFDEVAERATATWQHGTSTNVRAGNAEGGSGVTFDDGGNPFGAMGSKLAYMVFSPFPWAGGSVGFHIGKVDTFLWYFLLWRASKAARVRWRQDRTLILMIATFVVPTTVMYATSFANVGLSLRQRLVVVVVTAVLAMISWPKVATRRVERPQRVPTAPLRVGVAGAPTPVTRS
jgi:hypothetical protein